VVKTPPPVTAPRTTPVAAAHVVPEGRPAAKSSTHPVVKTPPPATVHHPEAEKPGHETASAAAEHTPGAESGFDDDVPTSPRARQAAREAEDALTPESTPVVVSTPGAEDFSQSERTPPPSQALSPVGATAHPVRESKNWPIANLSFAHPPAMPEGMSAEGAMALPTPAPLSGPLFANVADLPVKTLVGHAEVGLSRLTGLAALVHKHRHLKYVAASGVLVVLIIAVILLSWQGEKGVSNVAEIERKARAAALAAEPVPAPPEVKAPALAPSIEPEPSKPHAAAPAHASKRVVRPSVPAPAPAPAQNGKAAPVEDPFAAPAGMTRSAEKPIPLAAIQGKRATAANEPRVVSQSQISEVVRKKENQAGLKTCYERALKRDGRLRTGRLDITVSIGPMGTVQRVQVHGSADFMVIDKCLKEAIRHWRFPASSEEYATSFPLILQGG
jgi:outer membrane biosynthesis protein TonB